MAAAVIVCICVREPRLVFNNIEVFCLMSLVREMLNSNETLLSEAKEENKISVCLNQDSNFLSLL